MFILREKDVEKYLSKRVRQVGGEVRKVSWIGRRGAPDRLILLPGKTIWAELKGTSGRLAPHQAREIARLEAAGCVVWILWTKEDVDAAIKNITGADSAGSSAGGG
jgi:hypothetical protein